jgi:ABC-type spermidine/putrescine transport system permease subunit II
MLRPRWRFALFAGTVVPLVTPGIVHAIALRIAIRSIGIAPGPLAVLFGHVVHATPLAAIMIGARLAATPRDLMEAARDLGAGPIAVFAHVRLPWLGATMLAAAVLAGLNSFDDFVRSFFLAGYTPTLPVLIFGRLRSGLTPEINALATLALLSASAIGAVAAWMIGWWRRPGRWSPANGHLPHQEPEDYCDVSMVPRERVKRERRAPRPDRWSGGKSAAAPAPVGGEPLASPPRREVGH